MARQVDSADGSLPLTTSEGYAFAAATSQLNTLGWTGTAKSFQQWASPTTDSTLIGKIASGPQAVTNPDGGGTIQKPGQAPAVGATVRKSAPVVVVVYAKKQIALPVFTLGLTTTEDAVGALESLGASNIKVVKQSPAPSAALANTFMSLTPSSGSVADFDTLITVTVWGDAQTPPTTTK